MSLVAIGLDLLLVTLLVVALALGLRLNQRLKNLRDGQASFVKAVAELDAAATRADAGLRALRAASEETHDDLLTRIETARVLIARLDSANGMASARGGEVIAAPAPPASLAGGSSSRPMPAPAPARRAPVRGLDDDLFEAEPAGAARFAPRRPGERT